MKKYIEKIKVYKFLKKSCNILKSIFQHKYVLYLKKQNTLNILFKQIVNNIQTTTNEPKNILVFCKFLDIENIKTINKKYNNKNIIIVTGSSNIQSSKNISIIVIKDKVLRKHSQYENIVIQKIINYTKGEFLLITQENKHYNLQNIYCDTMDCDKNISNIIIVLLQCEINKIFAFVCLNAYLNNNNADKTINDMIKINHNKIKQEKIKKQI
ncbi:hypothetical protein AB837_00212 [bacterium AB1]|nr:hypothetical protein AB837_00212 [bacterium AB1]